MPDLALWGWLLLFFLVSLIVAGGAYLGYAVRQLISDAKEWDEEEEWRGCLAVTGWQPGAPIGCLGCFPIIVPILALLVPALIGIFVLPFECFVLILLIIGLFLVGAAFIGVVVTGWLVIPLWPGLVVILRRQFWPWRWAFWSKRWWPWRWPLAGFSGPPGCLAAPFSGWPLGALVGFFWLVGINILVWVVFFLCLTSAIVVHSHEGSRTSGTVERGVGVLPSIQDGPAIAPSPAPTATATIAPTPTLEPPPTAVPTPSAVPTPPIEPTQPLATATSPPVAPTPTTQPVATSTSVPGPEPILYQDALNDVVLITDQNQPVQSNVANHPADIGLVEIEWKASETWVCMWRPNKTTQSNSSAGVFAGGSLMGLWQFHEQVLTLEFRMGSAPAPGARIEAGPVGEWICFIVPNALMAGVTSVRVASYDRPNPGDLRGFDDTPLIPLVFGAGVPE